jgi:23S rRNA (cytosine1962-C5)-methyltransferase
MPDADSLPASSAGTPADQLANRLRRVHRHLRKWAKRTGVTCYRLYEKDIPDQPLIVDWYDGDAVVWAFDRTRNETPAQEEAWVAEVVRAVCAGLDVPTERVFLKRRFRQKDRQEGDGQYHRLAAAGTAKIVLEHGLSFEVNLSDYLDTGLFLDHRPTRLRVRGEASGRRMLNLFAYTGAFTVHAAAGGAVATTTVDLSNTYVDWAGRNLALNGITAGIGSECAHRLVRADCLRWLSDAARQGPQYDLIVCDPPTFSNSTAMAKPFAVGADHPWLLARLHDLLRPGGIAYFSTNFRGFRLEEAKMPRFASFTDISAESVPEDFRNRRIHQCWRMVK